MSTNRSASPSSRHTPRRILTSMIAVVTLASCGTGSDATGAEPPTSAGITKDTASTTSVPTTVAGQAMRGLRYCEILLLAPTAGGLRAEVYNTYPLNDCPADQWQALDTVAVAEENGVPFALANGPRFWLMDAVKKADRQSIITIEFGGLAMNRYAVVEITSPETVGRPYTAQSVDRKAVFTFAAGRTIYVLTTPEGDVYVMQSWSQQRDPVLSADDLATLGARLQLPPGWTYSSRVLDADLVVDTTAAPARVLQDEFLNSYSLIPEN